MLNQKIQKSICMLLASWDNMASIIGLLRWRHNGCDSVANHQPHDCLLNRLFRQTQIKVNIKVPRHWPLCGEFPAQMASNAENVSIWWHHHVMFTLWIQYQALSTEEMIYAPYFKLRRFGVKKLYKMQYIYVYIYIYFSPKRSSG